MSGTRPLIKIGGNALVDTDTKSMIISQLSHLYKNGMRPVIVHGGGIEIKQLLNRVGLNSEFIGGHRITDLESMKYVEMALSGFVNKDLTGMLNAENIPAVGISGRDAATVISKKRFHVESEGKKYRQIDIGYVGDVDRVNPKLIHTLLDSEYVPVVSPVSLGPDGFSYNINADMFAGHLSASLNTNRYIVLSNIDGLLQNVDDPDTLIEKLSPDEARNLFGDVIRGGMIPKIESCLVAVESGVDSAHIINGTKKETLLRILLSIDRPGTEITAD